MKLPVTKMHGIGNSYVIIDDEQRKLEQQYPDLAKKLSDKSYGVGSDGILVVNKGRKAPYWMRVFNPDGSEAEMCGNGIRMFARYLHDRKKIGMEADIEVGGSQGGRIVRPRINADNTVTVGMGKGQLLGETTITANGAAFAGFRVSVGNPHFIIFTNSERDAKAFARQYGAAIEHHSLFPQRTNVEFVYPKSKGTIIVHVWERGAGKTLSCGTGACAAAFAAYKNKKTANKLTVELPGGALRIEIQPDDRILMTGPAAYILDGTVDV